MIPYNPSSFNSNKTILEQILELKNWLKDHPQYKIYCSSENGATLQNVYTLSNVYDNTDMDAGDVVLFANGTIASVYSVDRDNNEFIVVGLQSIVGPQGPVGPSGYSLRVSTENYVNDSTAYSRLNLEPTHGVRTGDTILFANGYVGIMTTMSGTSFYVSNSTISTEGPQGPQGVSITNATIDSSGHLIITLSSGSTIDAGSVVEGTNAYIIQLTSYTGTLSADDLAIVNDPSKLCIIDYYENSKHSFYFKDRQITGGWRFSNLDYVEGSQITIMWYFEIDSTTGAYLQDYSEVFVRAENINSYGATSGQVLQADGNGGASWQTPSGGLNRYTQYISTWSGSDWNLARNIIQNAKYVSLWITGSFGMTVELHPTYFSSSTTTFKFVGNGCDNSNNFINYRIDLNTSSRIMTYYTYTIETNGAITYATSQTNVNITFVYLNDNSIT